MLLTSIPLTPAQAAEAPAQLVVGGQGSVSWSLGSMKPGDQGTRDVELRNVGTSDAFLKMWISDLNETDHRGDGAALSKYLRFNVSADGLASALDFPVSIDQLPRYPSGGNQLTIGPIAPEQTVVTHWSWEFVDTGTPQNDAQGDGISFTINYLLAEVPPPGEAYSFVVVDLLGKETVVGVNATGVVQEDVDATDPGGIRHLSIYQGTTILTKDGLVPSHIVLAASSDATLPGGPDGSSLVGSAYVLEGYLDGATPADVRFAPQAGLALGIDSSRTPAGVQPMGLYALNATGWSPVPGPAGALTSWEVRGLIGGTGTYAIFAGPNGSGPNAFLTAHDLVVSPVLEERWWPVVLFTVRGEAATVRVLITNEGASSGSYVVPVTIDGRTADSQVVILASGESREVTFNLTGLGGGDHEVRVAGQAAQLRTETTVEWPTIIVLIIAAVLAILYLTRRRRSGQDIPRTVMADYKDRVMRELIKQNLTFKDIAQLTSIEERKLLTVLDELWREGRVRTTNKTGTIHYVWVFSTLPRKKGPQ